MKQSKLKEPSEAFKEIAGKLQEARMWCTVFSVLGQSKDDDLLVVGVDGSRNSSTSCAVAGDQSVC